MTDKNKYTKHVNKHKHSLKLANRTADGYKVNSHVICHKNEELAPGVFKVVAHVKAGW